MTETQKQAPASLISKLTAIRRLMADPGATAGEKAAATQMYEKLKREYDLTEDILGDQKQIYRFDVKDEFERKLICQILYKVCGNDDSVGYWDRNPYSHRSRKTRKAIWVELTPLQAKEVAMLFRHYRKQLAIEMKRFFSAFVAANDIYPDDAPTAQQRELTAEERKELLSILNLARSIDPSPVPSEHPLLGDGKE